MLFINRQREIQDKMTMYCCQVSTCIMLFKEALLKHCQNADFEQLRTDFIRLHSAESLADDILKEIQVLMYGKSLFPESREDIMQLLNAMDNVPNRTEKSLQEILIKHIQIPEIMTGGLLQLADICCLCVNTMVDSAENLFKDFANAASSIDKIDKLESEADELEARIIEKVFSLDLKDLDKLLFCNLVRYISSICDRAESAANLIHIIVVKRGA
jgi:uncharacterized protein